MTNQQHITETLLRCDKKVEFCPENGRYIAYLYSENSQDYISFDYNDPNTIITMLSGPYSVLLARARERFNTKQFKDNFIVLRNPKKEFNINGSYNDYFLDKDTYVVNSIKTKSYIHNPVGIINDLCSWAIYYNMKLIATLPIYSTAPSSDVIEAGTPNEFIERLSLIKVNEGCIVEYQLTPEGDGFIIHIGVSKRR